MLAGIVLCGSCLLCALVFFFMTVFGEKYSEPINFWSGDATLKSRIKDLPCYNADMSVLYRVWAAAWLIIALISLFSVAIGFALVLANVSVGVYTIHHFYKRILRKYS